jgi:mannosyltransferase
VKGNALIRKDFLISLLLFAVCFVLRLLYISSRDIALDEPFTLYYSQQSIENIIGMLYNENNPPFHFIFLHFWIKLFGISAFSVRLTSVLFGSLTVVVIYNIGSKFFNRTIGIIAALILCFSTMHIFFAHEARVYPLFCLLTSCSLFFFLSIIKNTQKKSNYIWLFLSNLLLIYSHYFGFYVIFIEVVSILIVPQRKQLIKPFLISFSVMALSYIPILMIFLHRMGTSTSQGTWVAPPGVTEVYGNLNRFLNDRINTAVLILVLGSSFFLLFKKQLIPEKLKELWNNIYFKITFIWFVVPYLFMFLISFKYPMFIDRYILYTSIPFYLCIAIALSFFQINSKYAILAASVFLASMLITIQLNPDNNRRLKEVADLVRSLKTNNTLVLLAPDYAYMGFAYHYNLDYFMKAPETIHLLQSENIFPVFDSNAANSLLDSSTFQSKDCIYIQAGTEFVDPENAIFNSLSSRYKHNKMTHVFEIYNIYYFSN